MPPDPRSDAGNGAARGERSVMVGVCGGIAIYKSVELVRGLVKEGFSATVLLTEAAKRFVMPLTFAAVSRAAVLEDETAWQAGGGWFQHIEAAHRAQVLCVAPATANTLAKMATGLADNLLTAAYLAFRGPVVIAPAMNWAMYEHPATQENLRILADRGADVLGAAKGDLACGEEGSGRMADAQTIFLAIRRAFNQTAAGPLAGRKVVVTAGGTREPVDAVRFVGNRSSGRMGRALADEAYLCGADVTLVSTVDRGETAYRTVTVETAAEMAAAVRGETADADVLVMAAAVADFTPRQVVDGKIERGSGDTLGLELVRTEDILLASARPGLMRVGFAAEAGPHLKRARAKYEQKGVDLLVFNDVLAGGVGIGSEENEITIITPQGDVHVPRTSKVECARAVMTEVQRMMASR